MIVCKQILAFIDASILIVVVDFYDQMSTFV